MNHYDIIIVGAGAAGCFAAINMAEFNPDLKIVILEKGKSALQKVKISGGGRCNVTHAEFIPSELIKNYPRGEKELLGPFHQFMTGDTIEWFEKRGVNLKIEEDGRMFPVSDSSQTIIDCFLSQLDKHHIEVRYRCTLEGIHNQDEQWEVRTNQGLFHSSKLVLATGSNPKIWKLLEQLGHSIVKPVPSLFTFDIDDERIKGIPGVVVKHVEIKVSDSKLESSGPLLITHVGMSAPAILKLSAFGALELSKRDYQFDIRINFIGMRFDEAVEELKRIKGECSKKTLFNTPQFEIPKRLWHKLLEASGVERTHRWADLNRRQIDNLSDQLTNAIFKVYGKSTFKEEFVTAGGIDLKEINFKSFESKLFKDLYFAGEILNIDAVTGGFNFQNAWTGAYILAKSISE